MSRLSPDALFHFTTSFDNLVSILENDFYPRYCYEECLLTDSETPWGQRANPMVCFCDILLSQTKSHIKNYGPYGLGLSKEWSSRQRLNPVLYYTKNSLLASQINNIPVGLVKMFDDVDEYLLDIADSMRKATLAQLKANKDVLEVNPKEACERIELIEWIINHMKEVTRASNYILKYLKPYSGPFYRNGQLVRKNVRFYDEKEWRYVADIHRKDVKSILGKKECNDAELVAIANKKLEQNKFRLKFKPNEIKYVIVEHDDERIKMIRELKRIKSKNYDEDTVEILKSRIITSEQILNDF